MQANSFNINKILKFTLVYNSALAVVLSPTPSLKSNFPVALLIKR